MKKNKKFAVICGGECRCEKISTEIFENSFVIAADSGYDTALSLNVKSQLLVGDMDSVKSVPEGIPTHRVKAEKDDTDTMLAVSIALDMGADEIYIVGGGGGRADHWLSNIFLLESLCESGIHAELHDGINRIFVMRDSSVRLPSDGGYFGILALEDSVVSAVGCKYPLDKATLTRTHPYAVSNEITDDYAEITVKGRVIITVSAR